MLRVKPKSLGSEAERTWLKLGALTHENIRDVVPLALDFDETKYTYEEWVDDEGTEYFG